MSLTLPAGYKPDPAKVEAAIVSAEADLAALRAEHDEKAAEADDLWRQVLDAERRLHLFQEVKAATEAPVSRAGQTGENSSEEERPDG